MKHAQESNFDALVGRNATCSIDVISLLSLMIFSWGTKSIRSRTIWTWHLCQYYPLPLMLILITMSKKLCVCVHRACGSNQNEANYMKYTSTLIAKSK